MNNPPRCCHIGCGKPAEFEIEDMGERDPHQATTLACEDHVGALIGSVPPAEPKGPWTVHNYTYKEATAQGQH